MLVFPRINKEYYRLWYINSLNSVMVVCLEGKSEVQRLEVFEQDAQRQQRNPGLQAARRSHVRGAGPREPHSAVACCRRARRRSAVRIMQRGARRAADLPHV